MPSLTLTGLAYIAVSYTMRGWHERLSERNLPKHIRDGYMGRPLPKVTVRIKSGPTVYSERDVVCG